MKHLLQRTHAALASLLLLAGSLLAPAIPARAAVTCAPQYATDGHPFINATAQGPGSGKKVGFDAAHAETAGQADWVIDGGFSDMACALAGQGYFVEEMRTYPLTTESLSAYDVVVFGEANMPFTNGEEQAIADYVAGGKGVLFVGDHYQSDRNLNTWDSTEVYNGFRRGHYGQTYTSPSFNYNGFTATSTYTYNNGSDWLAQAFGFRFRYNALDLSGTGNFHPGTTADDPGILPPEQTYGVTSGVYSVATYAGATMSIVDPAKAIGVVYPNTNSVKRWTSAQADDPVAVYTDTVGTPAGGSATYGGINEGAYVVIAKPSAGKVAAAGDSSLWEDASPKYKREMDGTSKSTHDGWNDSDHDTLGINLVNWLATPDAATAISPALRQQVTPEPYNPFTISEPIVEPWSSPAAGYKWYDACTFKAGAYIGNTVCNNPPPVTTGWNVNYVPANVYPGNKPATYLNATGLTAGATYTNNFYWYVNQGGTQIGHRYNRSTGTYDSVAYNWIPLTADGQGNIQRWEFWNLDGTATRGVNMRLRVGTSSSYTTPFTSPIITQNAAGSYGYLKVEQSLGYSDGLHAALFTKDGILDTTAQILPGADTTITLPAGTYTLDIRNDTAAQVTGLSVKITAGQTVSLAGLEAPAASWSFDNVPANIYPGNTLAATLTATGLTPDTGYANQAYVYLTGGAQVSRRYDRSSGQFMDGLTAQTLTTDASGVIQRLEFWQITPTANTTADYNLRVKVDGQTKDTKVIKQVATGSFGYLTIEQSLGYSDGLHAALFTANGVLDTAVGINGGADTTVTLPAGTYSLDIKNDTGARKTGIAVTITAGQTVSLARLLAPQVWAFTYVPVNAYPGNTLALFADITGLTPDTDYSYQAYVYLTGGAQVSKRYNRTTGAFVDGLTAQTLTADADGAIQRWEFWQLSPTADKTSAYNARIKLGTSNKVTKQIKQVATGSFGSLVIEQKLGFSDGLHAALFSKDGVLDTTAGIARNADTTVTLPAGTYTLEIRDDMGVALSDVTFTVTAGQATSLVTVLDKTPPTISGSAAPAPNAAGWNNSDVTVTFACDDADSGVASCTPPVTLSADGAGQSVTGTATDLAGNTATATIGGINIDKTAPVISFAGGGTYTVDQTVNVTCTANDALSGLAEDPCAAPLVAGPAYTLELGEHAVFVGATDRAGNVATDHVSYTVTVTYESLESLTRSFVKQPGLANSLVAKLEAARDGAPGALDAYVNEVQAQSGKALAARNAEWLARLAQALKN